MFEYKVFTPAAKVDCGTHGCFATFEEAVKDFQANYPNWRRLGCEVYATGHKRVAYKRHWEYYFRICAD